MKKPIITLLFAVVCNHIYAQQTTNIRPTDAVQNDTIAQKNDTTATAERRSVVVKDSKIYGKSRQKIDNKAVKTPKFDTFNEKMKEPWLGDVLKDIIFH